MLGTLRGTLDLSFCLSLFMNECSGDRIHQKTLPGSEFRPISSGSALGTPWHPAQQKVVGALRIEQKTVSSIPVASQSGPVVPNQVGTVAVDPA